MRNRLGLSLFVAVAVAAGLLGLPADAANPGSGAINATSRQITWSGGPLTFTTLGTACATPQIPQCDSYEMTVGAMPADAPDILVSAAANVKTDLLGLYVYGPDGTVIARDTGFSSNPRASLFKPKPGKYSVRVEALLSQSGLVSYKAMAGGVRLGTPPDPEISCTGDDAGLGPPPAPVLQAMLTDDRRPVNIDVLVLLDGVTEAYARKFFGRVAAPYLEWNLHVIPTFQAVPKGFITSDDSGRIIDQAQNLVPNRRVPDRFDVVELLTNRDIEALGLKQVAGQAKCIGGASSKQHSFNVSEAQESVNQGGVKFGPITLVPEVAAKITAHEIGHLYGGQHHLANCVEGIYLSKIVASEDTSPCELMFNSADFISLRFGNVTGRILRGYAMVYSAANDPKR